MAAEKFSVNYPQNVWIYQELCVSLQPKVFNITVFLNISPPLHARSALPSPRQRPAAALANMLEFPSGMEIDACIGTMHLDGGRGDASIGRPPWGSGQSPEHPPTRLPSPPPPSPTKFRLISGFVLPPSSPSLQVPGTIDGSARPHGSGRSAK